MYSGGANVDNPHGFRPLRCLGGGEFRIEAMPLAAANQIIGKYDLVDFTNAGVVDAASAASALIAGVAMEAKAASSGGTILVLTNPDVICEAQCDDGATVLIAQTAMYLNADFIDTAAGADGMSNQEIDESSGANTSTLPLKVIRLFPDFNNAFGEFNRLEVMINNHAFGGGLGAAGV